jgi:hypothetical protein
MAEPINLICGGCGTPVKAETNVHVTADGSQIEWPKTEVENDKLCFIIACPNCGERRQCVGGSV